MAAARGLRETDSGVEPIADPEERRANRRLAWRVLGWSLATATMATAMFAAASVPTS
ncbi:MAG: hypothetical protein JRI23_00290 [Deltaproteobacteria bacterium]|nr:hypothetical protein [Deltaproteobacteria bacterium]MBW2529880.1 hypothetical protein [Deltaproteobacteria bacterium]